MNTLENSAQPAVVRGRKRRMGERGVLLISLLVGMTVMIILLTASAQSWTTIMQRERELELIFRGNQYIIALDNIVNIPFGSDVRFRGTVTDTQGLPIPGATVVLDIDPSTAAIPDVPPPTLSDGTTEFVVEVLDCFDIRAQVAGVFSDPPLIVTVLDACP